MYILAFIALYLSVGYLFHLVIFPEKKPKVSTYFKPGTSFQSKLENAKQTIVKQENGIVYCNSQIGPFAAGPPEHIHYSFDEVMAIENGELSVLINGEVKKIKPGEKLLIPKGVPHKPFNETADTIRFSNEVAFPEKFAFNLVQVYGMLDNNPNFEKFPGILFQMSLLSTEGFDSYLAVGPPVFAQRILSFLLAPAARLLGYKSYYKEYDSIQYQHE